MKSRTLAVAAAVLLGASCGTGRAEAETADRSAAAIGGTAKKLRGEGGRRLRKGASRPEEGTSSSSSSEGPRRPEVGHPLHRREDGWRPRRLEQTHASLNPDQIAAVEEALGQQAAGENPSGDHSGGSAGGGATSQQVPEKKIVGGRGSDLDAFPYFTDIIGCKRSSSYSTWRCGESLGCGGVLVSPIHVLTAGHCVDLPRDMYVTGVVVGAVCRENDNCDRPKQEREAVAVEVHPEYGPAKSGAVMPGFDIAVITLESPITDIKPANIDVYGANDNLRSSFLVKAIGLGRMTKHNQVGSGDDATELQEVDLAYIEEDDCGAFYPDNFEGTSMFCAGTVYGESTCSGDSGSPIFAPASLSSALSDSASIRAGYDDQLVVGLTSWGTKVCDGRHPSVFTKVGDTVGYFAAEMCNSFGPGDVGRRPGFCLVCESSYQGERPQWCDEVETTMMSSTTTTTTTETGATGEVETRTDTETTGNATTQASGTETAADATTATATESTPVTTATTSPSANNDSSRVSLITFCLKEETEEFCPNRNRKNCRTCGQLAQKNHNRRFRTCISKPEAAAACPYLCTGKCDRT